MLLDYHVSPSKWALLLVFVATVSAQYSPADFDDGPIPQRAIIPGSSPVRSQGRRLQQNQLLDAPPQPVKIRRPVSGRAGRFNGAPTHSQQQFDELSIAPRPVIEDPEEQTIDERPDVFTSVLQDPESRPGQFRPNSRPVSAPAAVFRPERPPLIPTPTPDLDLPPLTRQQVRQYQTTATPIQPPPIPVQQQLARQQQQQFKEQPSRQQIVQQQLLRNQQKQQPIKPQNKDRDRDLPVRERKPVAQVLRRYREDNEDGSITWGFENDDGSFKEETIGVDCVTRGKYGYIDPDGVRREYSYSSGIPCDKTKTEDSQGAATNEGYIDYQSNTYVFPNGDTIDLDKMVKNRARKPVPLYRN